MPRMLRSCALLALLTSAASVALLAQTLTFGAPIPFSVTLPDSAGVAHYSAADFNGDGKMDYLLEAWNQGDLEDFALLIGNGSGGFTTEETNVPVPGSLDYVVADVNNDGKADIITFEPGCETIPCNNNMPNENDAYGVFRVYVNQGDGRFLNTYTGTLPQWLGAIVYAVADFNGDGKPDVAVLSTNSSIAPKLYPAMLTVFLNEGDGLFTQVEDSNLPADLDHVPPGVPDLVAGNFMGNGREDLTFSYERMSSTGAVSGPVYTLPNNGKGGFGTPVLTYNFPNSGPANFIAGDLNGDGLTDLLYLNGATDSATVLLAKSGGEFSQGSSLHYSMAFPFNWTFADLNGDGKLDLAMSGTTAGNVATVAIYPGNGNGTFNSSYKAIHPSGNATQLMQIAPLVQGALPSVMFSTGFDTFTLYVNTTKK
jgi:hypothetical protein